MMELLSFGLCTTLALTSIVGLLLRHMLKREEQTKEERRDLLDRIMTRSWDEYKREKRMDGNTQKVEDEEPLSYYDQ